MRGIIAALLLLAWSCSSTPAVPSCVRGSEHCACDDGACDAGLACVSGMCFDLGELGTMRSASTRESRRAPAAQRSSQASGAGAEAESRGGSAVELADAGPVAHSPDAASKPAVPSGAPAADGGTSRPAAGSDSSACAAPGARCAGASCCEGLSCFSNSCVLPCLGNNDCPSHCCMPFDATRSMCVEAMQCAATRGPSAGSGANGEAGGGGAMSGAQSSLAGAGGSAGSCSAPGAACGAGAQACCDGAPCTNNLCAAKCQSEQDCASACCLSFFAGADKVCVASSLCRRR